MAIRPRRETVVEGAATQTAECHDDNVKPPTDVLQPNAIAVALSDGGLWRFIGVKRHEKNVFIFGASMPSVSCD